MGQEHVRRRPGGRTARNREKILRATLDILLTSGYDDLSISRVAARADVAETTVYRNWPTKTHLAAEALAELASTENPIPDTGSLEGDLRALLTQVVHLIDRPAVRRVVRAVVALDTEEPEIASLKSTFWSERFAAARSIVERAIGRGELSPGADADAIIEDLASVAYFRLLITGRPLDAQLIERSVAVVMRLHHRDPAQQPSGAS